MCSVALVGILLTVLLMAISKASAAETAAVDATSALDQVRSLDVPAATATINAEFEHSDLWEDNGGLIREAWAELHHQRDGGAQQLSLSNVIAPHLLDAIEKTRVNPNLANEERVLSSFVETGPSDKGLAYKTRLLTPEGVRALRSELDRATSSGIPRRRPNGMNRQGCIIDKNVDGAVSLPSLTSFVEDLISDIARPVGRAFFNDAVSESDDTDYFAFTIRYNTEEDIELKEHRDASVVTLNINLNLPEENYGGSSLYLLDEDGIGTGDTRHSIEFAPGMLLIHRGSVRHAALPITSGTRHNMIIWLFGEDGHVRVAPYDEEERLTVEQRWGRHVPKEEKKKKKKNDDRNPEL